MGCKVVSILGMPYELPHYPDKRGRQATFRTALYNEQLIEVIGTEVVFGLVLHRGFNLDQQPPRKHAAWLISEPTTGCWVVAGCTRQDALDRLAEKVAFLGGEDAFCLAINQSISKAQASGKALPPVANIVP